MIKKMLSGLLLVSSVALSCNGDNLAVPNMKIKVASWYGEKFHGKVTASGYAYNMNDMTAASMDYPFGTVLGITNKRNGKYVEVVVTDRGSFKKKYGRDIDLSKAAFEALDNLNYGLLDVFIEIVDDSKQFKKYKKAGVKFDREYYGI